MGKPLRQLSKMGQASATGSTRGSIYIESTCRSFAALPRCRFFFFSGSAGGPRRGHAHLLDANVGWGQDLLFLKRWYDEHLITLQDANRVRRELGLPELKDEEGDHGGWPCEQAH